MEKKNILLSDNAILEKQRKQLEDMQERKEQLELMIQWKKELNNLDDLKLNEVISYIESKTINRTLTPFGRDVVKKYYNKIDFIDLCNIIDDVANKTLEIDTENKEGVYTQESLENFLNKIPKFIDNFILAQKEPYLKDFYYLRKILINRFNRKISYQLLKLLRECLKNNAVVEDLKHIMSSCNNLADCEYLLKDYRQVL